VLETYNDQQWLLHFVNLCRELEPHLKPNESFVRAQVDVKKQAAIAIYLLGSSAEQIVFFPRAIAIFNPAHK
jgi:hypothetical protein